ncbi:MAG TPA: lytic murein transglycosylase, partial [Rugosimonospora sp.]|nr:lytic murein transglycosylase [Rugosimonospora sp.]
GRLAVPGLALMGVLAASGASGRWLVPQTAPRPAPSAPAAAQPSTEPTAPTPIGGDLPSYPLPSTSAGAPVTTTRPVDAVLPWATRLSPTVGISAVALAAYGYAQLSVGQTLPSCHLSWTILAGIGEVESNHGTANGAVLQPDGKVLPPIIGPALDGQGGRKLIHDTDGGLLDGDRVYDHAVGPMQFLPSTWQLYKTDADGDGVQDPNDINDAAMAAADYLCAGNRDLSTPTGWWAAVLSYNAIQSYGQAVFNAANNYGLRSRTVT